MANNTLRITELDFDSIRNNLKNFFQNQSEFTDYNFEASGLSSLLDILAYNTYYQAFYANMIGNEMFLDTAQKRSSIISHAKSLNYVPQSQIGATSQLNIRVTPEGSEDNSAQTLTLERYTPFQSESIDGLNYNFVTLNTNVATKDANGTFYFSNIVVKQGEVIRNAYVVSGAKPRYVIPSANVDISTVSVAVQESSSNTDTQVYVVNEDITEIRGNTQVFFLEESSLSNGNYILYFGDNVIGKRPSNGNIVIVTYLDTEGKYGNDANSFILLDSINGYNDNVIINPVFAAYGGSDRETIEEIRARAPIHYTVQNRAVIDEDYKAIILRDYPNIEAVSVWGGEDNVPPIYGKVFISMKPVRNFEISNLEKIRIVTEIIQKKSVLGITPEIVDPDYTYLIVNARVSYDPRKSTIDENSIKTQIRNAIAEFKDDNLRTFDASFYKSRLVRKIEDTNRAIVSCSLDIYLQKRFEPTFDISKNYEIDFNVPLLRGGINEKLYSNPTFTMKDSFNVTRTCYIEEVPESFTGVDEVVITNPGYSYTEAPTVTILGDGMGATAQASIVNGKISTITIVDRGTNYTRASITISGGGGFGGAATPVLQARTGNLRIYYIRSNGEKVYINENAGTIDYQTGEIVLNNLSFLSVSENSNYNDDVMTLNIQPETDIILPSRNNILDIDENDSSSIVIEMVPIT